MNTTERKLLNAIRGERGDKVLLSTDLDLSYACQYTGLDTFHALWDYPKLLKAYDRITADFPMDFNMGFTWISPQKSQILGSQNWIQNKENGVMQHPELSVLKETEYAELIEDPLKCLQNKILPRIHKKLDSSPMECAAAIGKAVMFEKNQMWDYYSRLYEITYAKGIPICYGLMFYAPFDWLADHMRGIRQISLDIRRRPEEVKAACEALADVMIHYVEAAYPVPEEGFPPVCAWVHLPPMISPRQFDTLFWPSFQRVCQTLSNKGYYLYLQFQGDYMDGRYFDYYAQLPSRRTMIAVEKQDFQYALDTIGKEHYISCSYPLRYLTNYSAQECIQRAKELLDMGMARGNFFFGFDKPPLNLSDAKPEKLKTMLQFVNEYGLY